MTSDGSSPQDVDLERLRKRGLLAPLSWANSDETKALCKRVLDICEAERTVILKNPHFQHEWIYEIITTAPVIRFLTRALDGIAAVENVFVIVKNADEDFVVPAHQDGINDRIELDHANAITVWYAMTDTTPANGCIEVIEGSHHNGYLSTERASERFSRGGGRPLQVALGDQQSKRWTPIPLQAGQACALDVCTLHKSGPNKTSTPRIGVNVRYVTQGAFIRASDLNRTLPLVSGTGTIQVNCLLADSHKEKK